MEFDEQGNFTRATVKMKDNASALVRPACPEDKAGLEKMFRSCSSQTLYTRFLSPGLGVPLRYLDRLMANAPPKTISLIAETDDIQKPLIVALMNLVETGPGNHGEIAIVVADDFQNRGLGSAMLKCLYEIAKARKVEKFIADVDAGNRRVFHLIQRSGLPCEINIEQGVAHIEVDMSAAP